MFCVFSGQIFCFYFHWGLFFLSLPHSARECLHVEGLFWKNGNILFGSLKSSSYLCSPFRDEGFEGYREGFLLSSEVLHFFYPFRGFWYAEVRCVSSGVKVLWFCDHVAQRTVFRFILWFSVRWNKPVNFIYFPLCRNQLFFTMESLILAQDER